MDNHRGKKRPDRWALLWLIIVIIVVVIIVLVMQPTGKMPMPIEETFHVSMTELQRLPSITKYSINGKLAPTLTLKRGKRYRFVLDNGAHPLYLTSSPDGGQGVPGTIAPNVDNRGLVNENGDLYVIIERDAKVGQLYYQSTLVTNAGGIVMIV